MSSYLKWLSRLIWHFSCALDANYNCCDERFCNHQDHCVSIIFITMTNVTLTDKSVQDSGPRVRTFVGLSESFVRISYDPSKDDRRNPSQRQSCGRLYETQCQPRFKLNKNRNFIWYLYSLLNITKICTICNYRFKCHFDLSFHIFALLSFGQDRILDKQSAR